VSPLQSPEHPIGHANKRARPQHHWRFGHSPRMPGHCTQRVGQHSVSGLTSRDSITYDANKLLGVLQGLTSLPEEPIGLHSLLGSTGLRFPEILRPEGNKDLPLTDDRAESDRNGATEV